MAKSEGNKATKCIAIGFVCFLLIVWGFNRDTSQRRDTPQVTQPLEKLKKQELSLLRDRQRLSFQQEALIVNGKITDQKMYDVLDRQVSSLSTAISDLGKEISVAREYQEAVIQPTFKEQFSRWDGSHRRLVAIKKKIMNDPSSFEHVSTRYQIMKGGKTMRVFMVYREKNIFGALVLQEVAADFDIRGKFIKFVE